MVNLVATGIFLNLDGLTHLRKGIRHIDMDISSEKIQGTSVSYL